LCVADTLFATQFWSPGLLLIRHLDSHAAALGIWISFHKGNQVAIEDSESDYDHKMPAQISHKKPKKVADPMETESSEETDEDEDNKASKEEKPSSSLLTKRRTVTLTLID
jgi:hypothetical protein